MKRIKKKRERPITHDQWIEIERRNGETVTTFYPPNDEFERLRLAMDPPPALIYRRMNFVHGVPPEYMWTDPPQGGKLYGGHCLLRILPEDWSEIYHAECANGNTMVVQCSNLQPRPAAFGPCPCARCTEKRKLA